MGRVFGSTPRFYPLGSSGNFQVMMIRMTSQSTKCPLRTQKNPQLRSLL